MTPEEWRQIREQLNAVLECEPALRSAHLQELVGSYPWLRQEIESLLSTYGQMASDFLEPPKLQSIEGDETSELLYESFIGRRLGPYKIIGQIGAGGMGEVFRASRADDLYEMDVAIKLIRSGQDSESVVTRFKHERQILASLSHTNIARLLDGGTTEEGLPYFVMELIDGQPINEYCNYYALAVNERLKLFLDVCSALSFAHQHRIVHRDIKPSNVLVTASGVPKLLDFGIAKILTPDNLDPKLDNTVTVLRILTPAYASPEQVKGEAITARSDVYSLGVVLYELLTGSSPYVSPGTTPHEIARAVCEEQPKKPSMALSETDSSQKKTPMLTKGEVNSLEKRRRQLRGDLDNIVLMSLRKEPHRRYDSVAAFANDIRLHLIGLPVSAQKDTLTYRLWKFGKRNVAAVTIASLLVLVLLGWMSSLLWEMHALKLSQTITANHPRHRPTAAVLSFKNLDALPQEAWLSTALAEMITSEIAVGEQLRIVSQEDVAQREKDLSLPDAESFARDALWRIRKMLHADVAIAGSYSNFQGKMRLDVSAQDTSTGEITASVTETGTISQLADLVSRAGAKLRQRLGIADLTSVEAQALAASFPSNPEATKLYAEGVAQLHVLNAKPARDLLANAVAADPGYALSRTALSEAWSLLGYDGKAAEEGRRALEQSSPLRREDQLLIEGRYRDIVHEKAKAIETYQTLFNLFPDNLDYGLLLADAQSHSGKGNDSLATLRALRTLGGGVDDARISLSEVLAERSLGDYAKEATAAAAAVREAQAAVAPSLVARGKLSEGISFRHVHKFEQAVSSLTAAREIFSEIGDQRGVASTLNDLGNTLYQNGDLEGARSAFHESLAAYRSVDAGGEAAAVLGNMANVIGDQGDLEGAAKLYEKELAIVREIDDRRSIGETLNNLGTIYVAWGELTKANQNFQQCLAVFREFGDQYYIATALDSIGTLRLQQGRLGEARSAFDEEHKIRSDASDQDGLIYPLEGLGETLSASGELSEAKQTLNNSLAISRRTGEKHMRAEALSALGFVSLQQGDLPNSHKYFEEALSVQNELGEKYTIPETQLGIAEVALQEERLDEANAFARQALKQAKLEKLRDDEIVAHSTLADVLLAQRKIASARTEISVVNRMARSSQNPRVRLTTSLANARIHLTSGEIGSASHTLHATLTQARRCELKGYVYEATLVLGEVELKSGRSRAGQSLLENLEKQATSQGFQLIANRAAVALRKRERLAN